MDLEYKKQLLAFLYEYISENKRNKFEEIVLNRTRHLSVVLENIFQPHNASAVLRSCDLFGVQDIHVIENNNDYRVNPQVALGSSKWLNLHKHNEEENNTVACFEKLKADGYRIVATTPHTNDQLLDDLDLTQKTALVFGTELEGLSDVAMEHADAYVKIPMYGFTESFNISVSAALSLYALTERMRKSSDIQWQLSEEEQTEIKIEWCKQVINTPELYIKKFEEKRQF